MLRPALFLTCAVAVVHSFSALAQPVRHRIVAGTVERERIPLPDGRTIPDNRLKGSFRIEQSAASGAVVSPSLRGGACLIADLNRLGLPTRTVITAPAASCSSDEDCTGRLSEKHRKVGWYSYCAAESRPHPTGLLVPSRSICWTRPGPQGDYCKISQTALPVGTQVEFRSARIPAIYLPTTSQRTRWRVRGCLNGAPVQTPEGLKLPCRDNVGDKSTGDGPLSVPN